jgi:Tfp pilus assembly PilM family ATPase
MAKYISIEWDSAELRIAIGRNRGQGISVDETHAIALAENATPTDIGEAIKQAVGDGSKGVETLVAIPRSAVEIRQIQLPAAPADELPEMVRFQAMRQFSTIGENWPLDFVELERTGQQVQVLASVISPTTLQEIKQVCEASGQVAQHLCLRPFASADLLKQHLGDDDSCRLIADVMSSSADLGVVVNGQLVFMRTVRLPAISGEDELPVQGLMGEIRRTMAAASNHLSGQQVAAVTLFGSGKRLEPLRKAIQSQLKLDAEIWSPFTNVRLQGTPPTYPGRYAALLGMMLNQATGARQAIDFLNPRKRPKAKTNREKYLLYTAMAVATAAVLAIGVFMTVDQKNRHIRELTLVKEASKISVVKAKELRGQADKVLLFKDQSLSFLDELSEISAALPTAKNARVEKMTGSLVQGLGSITMDIKVRGFEHISEVENSLKDVDRQVQGKRSRERSADSGFPWSFQTITSIDPLKKRQKFAESSTAIDGDEEVESAEATTTTDVDVPDRDQPDDPPSVDDQKRDQEGNDPTSDESDDTPENAPDNTKLTSNTGDTDPSAKEQAGRIGE